MNELRRRGPIASLVIGGWNTINFTRRPVLNLLFLLLLPALALLLLAALFGRLTPLESRTTLVLCPLEGRLVEQYTCDA